MKINIKKLTVAYSNLDKTAVAAINELAPSLKIILEQGGSIRKSIAKFLKGAVSIEVDEGEAKLVKLSEVKNVKRVILEALGECGLYNYENGVEDWNANRAELKPARLENLRRYQACERNIRAAIKDANGDGESEGPKEVTVATSVSKVVSAAKRAKETAKARKQFIADVIAGLKKASKDL